MVLFKINNQSCRIFFVYDLRRAFKCWAGAVFKAYVELAIFFVVFFLKSNILQFWGGIQFCFVAQAPAVFVGFGMRVLLALQLRPLT